MFTSSGSDPRANRLLAALSPSDFDHVCAHLETLEMTPRTTLFRSGDQLSHVYFPHSGVICLMASMRDDVAECAAVGPEGFVGFEVVLGGEIASHQALVQLPGAASRISIERLRQVMERRPSVRDLLLRYVRYFLIQALQSVACNSLHAVEERCAKWLLTAHDRNGGADQFNLTQEFLAEVLGVHRPSVTIVARTLQSAGLIRYSRGVIVITDRRGLEEAACECYAITRQALDSVLPATAALTR